MRPGTVLLVLLLTGLYLFAYSREHLHDGGPPAFFLERREGVTVMLGAGFPEPGIHQFYDGATLATVIEVTGGFPSSSLSGTVTGDRPLLSGEALCLLRDGSEDVEIQRKWMPASQRMALGIPLHPDRMTLQDWEALPGIGPRLASRIEEERQRNGEFRSFEALDRVSGIGPGRLAAWKDFF